MIGRDVYSTGRYVEFFQPDEAHNPFCALYAAKRTDVISSIRSGLLPGGTVLDLGGGPGRMAVPLARDYRVTLCDVSADMLRIADSAASTRGVSLSTLRGDASEPLPFASGFFDRAICTDLLVHLTDPVSTLRELRRVVRPNGELLVDTSNSSPWWILRYPRALGRRPADWLPAWRAGGVSPQWQGTVCHHSHTQFMEMLEQAGLAIVQERRYGPVWCAKWFLARCRPMTGA